MTEGLPAPERAFFDLDGTLTDPQLGILNCISHAFAKLGRTPPPAKEMLAWIGPPLKQSFQTALGDADIAEKAVTLYRERFAESGLFENQLISGIPKVLDGMNAAGVRCWVVTSKPTVYARRIVDHFGLAPYFESVFGSELDGTRTDKSELIRHVLDTTGSNARATVMIGDRRHDIAGARANQMNAIGVTWGFGSIEELRDAGARVIIDRVSELGTYWHH